MCAAECVWFGRRPPQSQQTLPTVTWRDLKVQTRFIVVSYLGHRDDVSSYIPWHTERDGWSSVVTSQWNRPIRCQHPSISATSSPKKLFFLPSFHPSHVSDLNVGSADDIRSGKFDSSAWFYWHVSVNSFKTQWFSDSFCIISQCKKNLLIMYCHTNYI